ncbi:V-type ATPase subunit [Candidatus Micrarchaeota archaeon]|nr:V-type ATPase subunit [Candidatus Micrarchaeota archaeon]
MLFPVRIGPLEYGYANARVRGMRGLLIKSDYYDELVNLRTIGGMIESLQRTHYKEHLLDAAIKYQSSLIIERAAAKHYRSVAEKIRKIAPERDKPVIDALLTKWDMLNLKTVVVSKKFESDFSKVKPMLVFAGSLNESDLERIFNADERDLFSEVRRTSFGKILFSQSTQEFPAGMLQTFRKAMRTLDSFSQLQTMIDGYFYFIIKESLEPYSGDSDVRRILQLFRKEIDAKNILIIERLKLNGVKSPDKINTYLIKGGTLNALSVETLISAETLKEVMPVVRRTFSGFNVDTEVHNLIDLEVSLEKALANEKLKSLYKSIFSVGTLLGFLLMKEEEMHNLRKIAKAKEFGMPPEEVKKSLIIYS